MWEETHSLAVSFPTVLRTNKGRVKIGGHGSYSVVGLFPLELGFHSAEMSVEGRRSSQGPIALQTCPKQKTAGMASDQMSETHRAGRQMQAQGCVPSVAINLRLEITDLRSLSALSWHLPDPL